MGPGTAGPVAVRSRDRAAHRALAPQGVSKRFKTPGEVVHAVRSGDLSVASGEMLALLGPNGAAKPTTISLLRPLGDGTLRGRRVPPSHWLVQASHVSLGAIACFATAGVVDAWAMILTMLAHAAFRRDTARV